MLRDLLERCPNMATLELHQTNLTNVAIDNLPNRLVTLIITSSMVTPGWFQALTTSDKVLTHLKVVDLSHSSKTNNTDVKHLCARPSITTLKLNGCYRVTDEGFKVTRSCQDCNQIPNAPSFVVDKTVGLPITFGSNCVCK